MHVWDDYHDPDSNLLDVYGSRIRRKIDRGPLPSFTGRRGTGLLLGLAKSDTAVDPES